MLTLFLTLPLLASSPFPQKAAEDPPHIVLVAGDEEYRSEEALPMLARLLERGRFRCTTLFSIDPSTGHVDPDQQGHLPGLEVLAEADLLILFTRFRRLPDAQMRHLVDYLESGRPLIGIRTATHAFAYEADAKSRFAPLSWDAPSGGFGRVVLGETWVAHHGHHGSESTRGVIPVAARRHPILRSVADVWGPTDVYAIRDLPLDATVLLEGAVLAGMTPDAPAVTDGRNSPRMPIAWCREHAFDPYSEARQRVVCSTIGASVDLACEDLRRFFVNAAYWCLELEVPERVDARLLGPYEPTMFGFGAYRRGLSPEAFRSGASERK